MSRFYFAYVGGVVQTLLLCDGHFVAAIGVAIAAIFHDCIISNIERPQGERSET